MHLGDQTVEVAQGEVVVAYNSSPSMLIGVVSFVARLRTTKWICAGRRAGAGQSWFKSAASDSPGAGKG